MIRRILLVAAVIVVSVALAVAPFRSGPALASPGLVVQTADGAVQGVLASGVAGTEAEWRGIPYAAPPLGALRWQPPQPVTSWPGVRDATQFTQPCFQTDGNGGTLGSEDCLYLNVFAPPSASARSKLPVMVHLHPGGNAYFQAYTDASAFTARGVIVVTLDYRLGVFGFVGLPQLSAEQGGSSGEYGLLDQLAALRWVRDNIAAFGGDPANVTLFGSSAGSFDTVALMASPLSRGLITRAAVQGEVLDGLTGQGGDQPGIANTTIADAEQVGVQVAQKVGCQTAADVLACLRATPAATLVEAAPIDYVPWVGGKVLPQSPQQLLSSGPRIPLLVGFDREEQATAFFPPFPASYTNSNWVRDTNGIGGPPLGAQIRSLYPLSAYDSLFWSTVTAATDALRGCPTRRLANAVSQGAPVWRYLDTHAYENDPNLAQFRAAHVMEDPFLWGNFSLFPGFIDGYVPTPAERVLSQRMTGYWTNFAKTGNPNGPGLPTWPQYNSVTEPTLTLDDQIGVINNYHDQQCTPLDTITTIFPPPWLNGQGVGPPFFPRRFN
jgi:para-nitrobenzyl esterase